MKSVSHIVKEKKIGTRVILGTDHPVMMVLECVGQNDYQVRVTCNGITDFSSRFSSLLDAADYFNGDA